MGQALEVDIHVGPVPVHARDLDVAFEVSTKIYIDIDVSNKYIIVPSTHVNI